MCQFYFQSKFLAKVVHVKSLFGDFQSFNFQTNVFTVSDLVYISLTLILNLNSSNKLITYLILPLYHLLLLKYILNFSTPEFN